MTIIKNSDSNYVWHSYHLSRIGKNVICLLRGPSHTTLKIRWNCVYFIGEETKHEGGKVFNQCHTPFKGQRCCSNTERARSQICSPHLCTKLRI